MSGGVGALWSHNNACMPVSDGDVSDSSTGVVMVVVVMVVMEVMVMIVVMAMVMMVIVVMVSGSSAGVGGTVTDRWRNDCGLVLDFDVVF